MPAADELENRLIDFAVRVIKLVSHLPKTQAGHHLTDRLLRSGTFPAAYYAQAFIAESPPDVVHQLKLCLKELNETRVWLDISARSDMLPALSLNYVSEECFDLSRLVGEKLAATHTSDPNATFRP
jgi:four helix bundle protein